MAKKKKTKKIAIAFAKESCNEKDNSKQRNREWNDYYDRWIKTQQTDDKS